MRRLTRNFGIRKRSNARARSPSCALRLDPLLAEAHATFGWTLHWQYRRQEALAEFEKAHALNPSLADGRYAHALMQVGRAAEAVEFMQQVMLHDPFPPGMYLSWLGNSYYLVRPLRRGLCPR